MNYSWPGNIRELQNAVNRSVVLAENDIITLKDLPAEIRRPGRSSATARGLSSRSCWGLHCPAAGAVESGADADDCCGFGR